MLKKTSIDPDSAEDLVAKIAAGKRAAEAVLYQRFGPGVFFMLRQRCGDIMLAEDLTHETFRIIIERLRSQSLEKPERLSAYIHRVAVNLAIGEIRKSRRRNTHTDTDTIAALADLQPEAYDLLDRECRVRAVHQLLQDMPVERDQELLQLYFIEEKDKTVICRQLELSTAHFDRVLYRAKQRFRAIVEAAGEENI